MLYLPESDLPPVVIEERNEPYVTDSKDNGDISSSGSQEAKTAPVIPTNQAVIDLLNESEQQHRQGRLVEATATLERAQRIAPKDPRVYYRLAVIRLEQGQYMPAEQLARKAIASAGGNHALQASAWELIAVTRQRRNDQAGADQARANAAAIGGY